MPIPPVFTFLQQTASLDTDELHHVFNMEIGIVACVRPQPPNQPEQLEKTLHLLRNAVFPAYILGEIIPGESIILQPTVQIM